MENPFETLNQKLDHIIKSISELEEKPKLFPPRRIPLKTFCEQHNITRQTAHAWNKKGLIKTETIGMRRFVINDSITVNSKYKREPHGLDNSHLVCKFYHDGNVFVYRKRGDSYDEIKLQKGAIEEVCKLLVAQFQE